MKRRTELYPHEQLLLLALRDDKGTLESKASMHGYALGGALLAELSIQERINIDDTKKAMVDVVDRRPLGEPVLDDCLERVVTAKRRARASTWVQRFANLKRLRHRVAAGLCRQGILRDDEDTVLLLFTRKVYPTIDPRPERELLGRLRDAVLGDAPSIAPEVALVVTVANASGLLGSPLRQGFAQAAQAPARGHRRRRPRGSSNQAGRPGSAAGRHGRRLRRHDCRGRFLSDVRVTTPR